MQSGPADDELLSSFERKVLASPRSGPCCGSIGALLTASTQPGLRVLVVEDDLDSAHSLATLLHAMDCEVEFALNGAVAIDVARRFMPLVALVDLRLPDMTGWEVARTLRADPAFGAPHVWALTGMDDAQAQQRSLEAGCEHHFVKPVDPALLERLLTALR